MKSRVAYLTEKNWNFTWLSSCCYCTDRAQNIPSQLLTVFTECSRFHSNRFTFSEVMAKRMNTTWSLALSRIVNAYPYINRKSLNVNMFCRFIPERLETLGPDLATAHFVVARHGAVKFEGSNQWISMSKNSDGGKYQNLLPTVPSYDIRLEAVDMSDTDMMYISLDNFGKYHNISNIICRLSSGPDLTVILKFEL